MEYKSLLRNKKKHVPSSYRKYIKECPGLNKHALRMSAPLYCSPQTRKGALIWKFAMSAVTLIQIVCNNDETRVYKDGLCKKE